MLCVRAVSPLVPRDTYGLKWWGGGVGRISSFIYIGYNGRRENRCRGSGSGSVR